MYTILNKLGVYSQNIPGLISLIIGIIAAAGLFYLSVIPAHNFIKYRVVRKCGARVSVSRGHLNFSPAGSFSTIGLISTLVLGMGFAKPVYFDLHQFRRPGIHTCFVSLTGLAVYLAAYIVSLFIYLILKIAAVFSIESHTQLPVDGQWYVYLYFAFFVMISYFRIYCIYSLLFNIIPFGTLDASEMLYMFLPVNWSDTLRNNHTITSVLIFAVAFLTFGKPGGFIPSTALELNNILGNFVLGIFGAGT